MKRFLYLSLAALMVLSVSCKKNPKAGTPSVKTLEATEIEANSARLNAKIDFAGVRYASVNYGFYWGTSKDQEGTYIQGEGVLNGKKDYSAVITGLTPETQYWYKAFVEIDGNPYTGEILNFTTLPKGAVDLGIELTRGDGTTYKLYWAKSNLCKSGLCASPEKYGDYYSWAETSPKDNYIWATYKFGPYPFSKYDPGSPDENVNKTVLDPEDDAVHVTLGRKWRMPTDAEWTALREQCDWKWTSDYNGTGVGGDIIAASNGNSIFLPAAGYRDNADLEYAGSIGYYWSSSLLTASPIGAWYVFFDSDTVIRLYYDRCNGYSIRPVYEE